jgi:hypothetical protein
MTIEDMAKGYDGRDPFEPTDDELLEIEREREKPKSRRNKTTITPDKPKPRGYTQKQRQERVSHLIANIETVADAPEVLKWATLYRAESLTPTRYGSAVRRDFAGLFDIVGWTIDGTFVGIQVTVKAKRRAHLKKWLDPSNIVAGRKTQDGLLSAVSSRIEAWFAYYDKPAARWVYSFERITRETLDGVNPKG